MLQWLRRRQEALRLAQADAEALIREHGIDAYAEARKREREGTEPERSSRVALAVAKVTGHRVGLDTATKMATDVDFSSVGELETRPERALKREPLFDVDQLAELQRYIKGR